MSRFCVLATALLPSLVVGGCQTTQVSHFSPMEGQEVVYRDGVPALVSKQGSSVVLVAQARRDVQAGERPAYVVAMLNTGQDPAHFAFSGVHVALVDSGTVVDRLDTFSYEKLVAEEKTRQVAAAILVGLSAGANAASAANAGYYSGSGTIRGPYGMSHVTYSGYDPTAASIARTQAAIQNDIMITRAVERGQSNLAQLENTILKDNTVFPGEWYGGQLRFERPKTGHPKSYLITVPVGADVHRISVSVANAS